MTTLAPAAVVPAGGGRGLQRRRHRRSRALSGVMGLVCGLLTVLVAWPGLDNELFRDEAVSADVGSRSLAGIWRTVQNVDAAHSAYYLLVGALPIDPTSATQLRLVSLVSVALAGAFVTVYCARRLGVAAGLTAMVAWPMLPAVVAVGLFARGYGLVTLFAVLSGLALLELLGGVGERRERRWWVAYAAAVAAMGLFSLLALLLVPAHAVSVALAGRRHGRRFALRWLLSVGAALVCVVPVVLLASGQPSPISWVAPPLLHDLVIIPTRIVGGSAFGTDQAPGGAAAFTAVVAALGVVAVIAALRRTRREGAGPRDLVVALAAPWLVVPLVLAVLVSLVDPIFVARYLWFVAPAAILLVVTLVPQVGVGGRHGRAAPWAVALVLVAVIAALSFAPRQALLDGGGGAGYRAAAELLREQARPGDVIVVDDDPYNFARSGLLAAGAPGVDDVLVAQSPAQADGVVAVEQPKDQWPGLLRSARRVWVITPWDGSVGPREKVAAKGRDLIAQDRFGEITLRLHAVRSRNGG